MNGANLKKHRKDVLRLLEFVLDNLVLDLTENIKADARCFVRTVEDPVFRMDQLGLAVDRQTAVGALNRLCGI